MKKFLLLSAIIPLFATSCAQDNAVDSEHIYIISTNDMHANINLMPQLASLVEEYEALGEVLVVDSGDRVSGNAFVDDAPQPGMPISTKFATHILLSTKNPSTLYPESASFSRG